MGWRRGTCDLAWPEPGRRCLQMLSNPRISTRPRGRPGRWVPGWAAATGQRQRRVLLPEVTAAVNSGSGNRAEPGPWRTGDSLTTCKTVY